MKRIAYLTGISLFLGILIALFVFIKLYNKPHIDVGDSKADYVMSIEAIAGDFEENEAVANEKYLDKIIQVEGVINDIALSDGNSILTLKARQSDQSVVCTMAASENIKIVGLQKGNTVTVRGICTGYLMDVILVRAIIVN
ncbi:MAG: hypothetical protein WCY89_08025 [Flavobacteriaceae bacterium]